VIRAVLGTNVLASGMLGLDHSSKPPAELLRRWEARQFVLVTSFPILDELARTLKNPYFNARIAPDEAERMWQSVQRESEVVEPTNLIPATATHPEDDLILATAVSALVDYLVTADRQLLALRDVGSIPIITPVAFLAVLDTTPGVH